MRKKIRFKLLYHVKISENIFERLILEESSHEKKMTKGPRGRDREVAEVDESEEEEDVFDGENSSEDVVE